METESFKFENYSWRETHLELARLIAVMGRGSPFAIFSISLLK